MKSIQYVAVALAGLAVGISLLRYRLLRDWRGWLIPVALLTLALALYQGIVGPQRGLERFVGAEALRSTAALLCAGTAFLIAVVLDRLIDEKDRAHESSRTREQWLRMLAGRLSAVVWTTNRRNTITSHVGGGHRRLGIPPNEYIGRPLESYFGGPGAAAAVQRASEGALDGECLAVDLVWHGQRYEGFVEPLYDNRMRVSGTIGFLLNSVDERYGSPSSAEAEALLALAAAHLPLLMWATDASGKVVFASGSAWGELDVEASDLVGATPAQALAAYGADDVGIDAHRRALAGESVEYRKRVNGRAVECRVAPRRDAGGRVLGLVGVAFEQKL